MNVDKIIIERDERGEYTLSTGDGRSAGVLNFGEIIEQIACLILPQIEAPRYAMLTPDEWQRLRDRRAESRARAQGGEA